MYYLLDLPIIIATANILSENGGDAPVDISGFITQLTSSITPAQVLAMLGSVVGVGMGFVLMWFGARKAVRIFSTAFSRGKIRI